MRKLVSARVVAGALSATALGAIGCGEDTPDVTPPPVTTTARGVLATSNPTGRADDKLLRLSVSLDATKATFADLDVVSSIQSVILGASGDGYLTFDARDATGGIAVYPGLREASVSAALGAGSRVIMGPKTNLMAPKGIITDATLGLIIVADFGAKDIKTYPIDANGDVTPTDTISVGAARSVWDLHYDAGTDVLYASGTDGVVLAYDGFAMDRGAAGPTRTITPTGLGNAKISVNLHGIAYAPAPLDLLFVSDVGDAASATDGQIIGIAMASTADGNTLANLRVRGAATGLGNPVDLLLEGANLYVAEKSNDTVLRYDAAGTLVGELDVAADLSLSVPRVESIALGVRGGIGGGALLVTSNPDGIETDAVVQIPFSLASMSARFDNIGVVTSIESVALSADGSGFVSYDAGPTGGVMLLSALDNDTAGGTLGIGDGRIAGALTTLVAPKGIDASGSQLIVADFGAKAIKVFAKTPGDAAPMWSATNLGTGARSVWDVAYDAASDRLFATGTDGMLLVYDTFSVDHGASGPTRMFQPTGSVNLHGIAYHAASDTLFLSDVGDTAVATDGQLFVVEKASTVSGAAAAKATIKGPLSKLGNPVDVALDGTTLYVAEKSNDVLLRFDTLMESAGTTDRAADGTTAVVKVESVAVIPAK